MQINDAHQIYPAKIARSNHFRPRPEGTDISLVVIHCISLPKGEFGTGLPEKLFTKRLDFERHPELAELRDVRVAPHVLIDRSGNITQFVAFNVAAWHAGESIWHGRKNCNDVSIGIEMEGTDDTPYEDAQYTVLSELLYELMNTYPSLSLSGVVGHSEVAPGRKTDPGPHFDWRRVFSPLLGRRFDEARAVLRSSN